MPRPQSRHPTELELEILKILWREQPLSGREIRDKLAPVRDVTYTSVMTILGIMEEKSYVRRKKNGARFEYSPRITQESTSHRMLNDLVERLFEGSSVTAMVNLLETSDVDPAELKQLRKLIQQREKEQS
jgi:BlaI family transcriptional regulator, penicillinase repressor